MRTLLMTTLSAAALLACSPAETTRTDAAAPAEQAQSEQTETERLGVWLDAKYEESLAFSPISKTFLGIKDASYGDVDDMSIEAEAAQLEWQRKSLDEMQAAFSYDKLDADGKLSWDLWIDEYNKSYASHRFPHQGYVFDQMNGAQGFFPQFLIQFHTVESAEDMDAYISRISGLATALGQLMDRTEAAADAGVVAPYFALEGVVEQIDNVLTGVPFDGSSEDSALLADARGKIQKLVDDGKIDGDQATDFHDAAEAAYSNEFADAMTRVRDWHAAQIETAGGAKGALALPDGDAFYAERLRNQTTTDLTADQIHELGLSEVARLRGEMEKIRELVEFDGDLQAFFEFVRTDDQFFFPDTDEGRQGYLDGATAFINYIDEQLPDYFGILPKADLEVKRVEAFREQDGAAQHYFPGTPDGSRPGIYYAHLSDMTAMPKNQMEVIAYHEGLPGHHMQISIAQELESVPQFRTQIGHTAYIEGWALYSEYLAKEMGAYKDPYSEFGRLSSEMFRAIRLVVDTGIHAKGWSEEEAVAYFMANSPEPEESIRSEIRRYFVMPGQATSYKIGMIEIQKYRAAAEAALGDKFDIKGFHDVVLGGGSVPMSLLELRINQWVESVKSAG